MDILPRGARKRVKVIDRAVSRLRMELRREPSDDEVAAAVDLDVKSYRAALVEANCAILSIDSTIDTNGAEPGSSFRDILSDPDTPNPEETLTGTEVYECLTRAFEQLPERLQILLSLYYYEGLTMREIGDILDLSESRVSQLHARAVTRLRSSLEHQQAIPETASVMHLPDAMPLPVFAPV
jgi:RNA polymerase sigma factor for flagellar operon FliA